MRSVITAGTAVALACTAIALHLVVAPVDPDGTTDFLATNAVTAIAWSTVGAVILRSRRSTVGLLLLLIGLAQGITAVSREIGLILLPDPQAAWWLWLGAWPFLLTLWFPLLLLLLPDDQPPSPRWKPFVLAGWAAPFPVLVTAALSTDPLLVETSGAPQNPLGGVGLGPLPLLSLLLLLITTVAALTSLVRRWRRGGQQREQLTWVALSGGVLACALPVEAFVPSIAPAIAPLVATAFSVGVGVALVRHRLLDVEVVVSRTLLYAGLTATLVGLYVTVAVLLGAVLAGPLPDLVATTLVAVSFAPLREALQRGLQRLLLGMQQDPWSVLRRALREVDDSPTAQDALPQLAHTVATAMQLPYAAIVLPDEAPLTPPPSGAIDVPLQHRGRDVGRLLVGVGGRLDRTQRLLLTDLTRQAAAAAHAAVLTSELQRSRDRLLASREQERQRLRRDLHDGLGPLLAAITIQLDAARRLAQRDPTQVDEVLLRARQDVQSAVADVRRLLEDLQPQALEELGLLRSLAALVVPLEDAGLQVELDLPAAVELPTDLGAAAYRIAAEALTNAARHAHARTVRLALHEEGDDLVLTIADDGVGLPEQPRPDGIGLSSMRERAAALGGSVRVTGEATGTCVQARLPRTTVPA